MKWLIAAAFVVGTLGPTPQFCLGAQQAQGHAMMIASQERSTPKGDWCQRPAPQMSKKAHPCSCHKADCADDDPNHLPAHTDAACLNFCNVKDCRCAVHDCL